MTVWKSFGASVTGPGHIRACKPNQDAWRAFHHTWCDGIIVSDGLGSKKLSDLGSNAACRAVDCAVYDCRYKTEIDQTLLIDKIKSNWLSFIAPLDPQDCSATCLFAFRFSDGIIRTGMLGDGLIAILKDDGSILPLTEDKTNGFSNVTSALSTKTKDKEWQFLPPLQEDLCRAVLLCTDGVSDDLNDVDTFVRGFLDCNIDSACASSSRNTRIMLEKWPVPKHSDDKTIACLIRKETEDD